MAAPAQAPRRIIHNSSESVSSEPNNFSSTVELYPSRNSRVSSFEIDSSPYPHDVPERNNYDPAGESSTSHSHKNKTDVEKSFIQNYAGMIMALLASIFFSISFLIVKILGQHGFPGNATAVLFNLGVLIPAIPAMVQSLVIAIFY